MEGVKSFVNFAIQNFEEYETIVCPCKQCQLNKRLQPQQVYDHLTCGTRIMPGYTLNGFCMVKWLMFMLFKDPV
jgi:hypothetical protein